MVIQNGGGRIFSKLPGMKDLGEEEKHVTENRNDLEFRHWAAMWGLDYATSAEELTGEHAVLELRIPIRR